MKKAFTFVETLIFIFVASLVLIGFISFALATSQARNKSYSTAEVQANMRLALEVLSQRIRNASDLNMASSTFGVDPGVLSLATASSTTNPMKFSLDQNDGTMYLTVGTSSPVAITASNIKVTNLVFTDLTGSGRRHNIKIDLTMNYNNSASSTDFAATQSIETAISLRK